MPTRPDCFAPSPACPSGDYCAIWFSTTSNPPTQSVDAQMCLPMKPNAGATVVAASGAPWSVFFTNVPPGDYLLRVDAPGLAFDALPIHLDPGEFDYETPISR